MDNSSLFSFTQLDDPQVNCLATSETKEQLLQYNLDKSLQIFRFRFVGNISSNSAADYDQLCKDFFTSGCFPALQCSGSPSLPLDYQFTQLGTNIMNMDFFDRITEAGMLSLRDNSCIKCLVGIAGETGTIRGCFDETFDGILISDQLREVLLNVDSERASLFSEEDRNEFIYNLFRLFVVGGALCQPDSNLNRYGTLSLAVLF